MLTIILSAQSNFLRVLHRHHPNSLVSSFVSKDTLPNNASLSTAGSVSAEHEFSRPPREYPEWRASVAKHAQRAGLGTISKALAYCIYGTVDTFTAPDVADEPTNNNPEDDLDLNINPKFEDTPPVELEWDNWAQDLARQCKKAAELNSGSTTPVRLLSAHSNDHTRRASLPFARRGSATTTDTAVASLYSQTDPQFSSRPGEFTSSEAALLYSYEHALSPDAPALLTTRVPYVRSPGGQTTTSVVSVGNVGVERAKSITTATSKESIAASTTTSDGRRVSKQRTRERDDERAQTQTKSSFTSFISYVSSPDVNPLAEDASSIKSATKSSASGSGSSASTSTAATGRGRQGQSDSRAYRSPSNAGRSAAMSPTRTDNGGTLTSKVYVGNDLSASSSTLRVASQSQSRQQQEKEKEKASRGDKGPGRLLKTLRPERVLQKLDSALEFVDGRR
jgi:hypothetical protein